MRRYRGHLYGEGDATKEASEYMALMRIHGMCLKTPYEDGDREFGLLAKFSETDNHVQVISHEGVPKWSGTVDEYYEKWILD